MPGILADDANGRKHHYFGAYGKEWAREVFSFWQSARSGSVERIAIILGSFSDDSVTAPLAIYRTKSGGDSPAYMLIQHGSYQVVHESDQPFLESGALMVYRGVQDSATFHFLLPGNRNSDRRIWQRYVEFQTFVLSEATRSFNSIHDRAVRCETAHIRDRSWMSDDLARKLGLDIDREGFAKALWSSSHQSFSLERWVAKSKFGPHYVACKTPLDNIRLTTFFAGEHEVRIIDPARVNVVETHGCHVVPIA